MLIQFELGHEDIALGRLKAIERSILERYPAIPDPADAADAALAGGPYRFVLNYLDLVHDVINDPALALRPAFAERMAEFPFLTLEREDLQSMSFYAWLRARLLGRPYYEVLLEVAGL